MKSYRDFSGIVLVLPVLFCFEAFSITPPTRPEWLDEPIPFFERIEKQFYGSIESINGEADERTNELLLGTGYEWGIYQANLRGFSELVASAPRREALTPHTFSPWLASLLERLDNATDNSFLSRRGGDLLAAERANLPFPQEWISRKLLLLAFLYRVAPIGLTDEPLLAHNFYRGSQGFAEHDAIHAGFLKHFFLRPGGDSKLDAVSRSAQARDYARIRNALARDVWDLEETSSAIAVAFGVIHEKSSAFVYKVGELYRRSENFAGNFPRTYRVVTDLAKQADDLTVPSYLTFLVRRFLYRYVYHPLAAVNFSPVVMEAFGEDMVALSADVDAVAWVKSLSASGSKPIALSALHAELGGEQSVQRTLGSTSRIVRSWPTQGGVGSCLSVLIQSSKERASSVAGYSKTSH